MIEKNPQKCPKYAQKTPRKCPKYAPMGWFLLIFSALEVQKGLKKHHFISLYPKKYPKKKPFPKNFLKKPTVCPVYTFVPLSVLYENIDL
jgi:hypothetical protein